MRITIILPVYSGDRPKFLRECVDSLLEQDCRDFGVLIMQDGPVSNAVNEYLRAIKDPHISVVRRTDNRGLAQTLNELIDVALSDPTCEYIARMDADDIAHRTRIRRQAEFLDQHREIDVVGSSVILIDDRGRKVGEKIVPAHDSELKRQIVRRCPFRHPSVMIRRRVFDAGFRYDPTLFRTEDYALWVDLAASGAIFANLPEPLMALRVDHGMYHRRHGLAKATSEFRVKLRAIKMFRRWAPSDVFSAVAIFLLRLSPPSLARLVYRLLG